MLENLCRFCGLEHKILDPITENVIINRFYKLLPAKITVYEHKMPANVCGMCNSKIFETIEFYDRVVETDRILREKLSLPAIKDNQTFESPDRSHTPKLEMQSRYAIVNDILQNIKQKGTVSISKLSTCTVEEQSDALSPYGCAEINYSESGSEWSGAKSNDTNSDDDYSEVGDSRSIPKSDSKKYTTIIEIIEPNYVCARCRNKFPNIDVLNDHLDNSDTCKDKDLKCEPCNKVFTTRRQYQKHVNGVHRRKTSGHLNICSNCNRKFTTPADLEKHIGICTGDFGEERSGILFKCKECYKTFVKKNDLMEHIRNHPNTLLCETCGKACETRKEYHRHKSKHMNVKKFACNSCDKRFTCRPVLLAHQHIHTGVKQYVCDTCGKTFAKKSSLNAHIRVHTGEKPYACQQCSDKFHTLDRLKHHIKKHRENNCYS